MGFRHERACILEFVRWRLFCNFGNLMQHTGDISQRKFYEWNHQSFWPLDEDSDYHDFMSFIYPIRSFETFWFRICTLTLESPSWCSKLLGGRQTCSKMSRAEFRPNTISYIYDQHDVYSGIPRLDGLWNLSR